MRICRSARLFGSRIGRPIGSLPPVRLLLAPLVCSGAPLLIAAQFYGATNPLTLWQVARAYFLLMALTLLVIGAGRRLGRLEQTSTAVALLGLGSCAFGPVMVALRIAPFSSADRLVGVALSVVAILVVRSAVRVDPASLRKTYDALTVIALVMLFLASFSYLTRRFLDRPSIPTSTAGAEVKLPVNDRPDIIHIIFDGLGRLDRISQTYLVDTARFERDLESRGLAVHESAVSNYAQTYLSLASMLSMEYLDDPGFSSIEVGHRDVLKSIIENAAAIRSLKGAGYEFELLSSGYSALDHHPLSDRGITGSLVFGDFEGFAVLWHPIRVWPYWGWTHAPHERRTRQILERLKHHRVSPRPRYVLAHLLVPHPPFVFRPDGSTERPSYPFTVRDGADFPGSAETYRAGYRAQVEFVLRELIGILQNLETDRSNVVLMVNGDHGPGLGWSLHRPTEGRAEERMSILMGVWPRERFDPPRSPVNLYRRLFNAVFDQHLPELPEHSYVSSWVRPFDFTEIVPPGPPTPGTRKEPQ